MADSTTKQVFALIEQAEQYADAQEKSRETALRYYNGDKKLIPYDEGFSSVVSKDVRKHIQKLMPSVMRTILSNDVIAQYQPAGPGKEEQAEQATDYINAVIVPECNGERAIHDAVFDALVVKTGILNWCAYRSQRVIVQEFSGQQPESLMGLDEIGTISDVEQDDEGSLSFRLTRIEVKTKPLIRAVPRGAFLIHPNATDIDDSPIVGERQSVSRSELVSRGYDKELVWSITADDKPADPDYQARRGEDYDEVEADVAKAMQLVQIYDVFVQMDSDGDGIAELHHFVVAEGAEESDDEGHIVLEHDFATEVPYSAVISEYEAHQFEGHSVAEDLIDVQDINTTLTRQTLDNIYQSNDPTPFIQTDAVEELDPLFNRVRGKPVMLAAGRSAAEAVQYQPVPFFGDKSWQMKQQMDAEAQDRTGINDQSGGLPGEALQNTSATAAQIFSDAAMARSEMLVRNLARGGLRDAFRGLLRLVVAHADQPRMVRLRGDWVQIDPRAWDAEMDCTVNVGLGAGTRERDFAILQQILGIQQQVLANLGADNPLVKPDQLYNTLRKMCETAGFASADPYFTKPDPAEVQAKMDAAKNQPSPEQIKAQTQMQIEQVKTQGRTQIEAAQMEADLRVKQAEIAGQEALEQLKIASNAQIASMKAELDMLKHRDEMQLEWAKLGQQERQSEQQAWSNVAR
ncbi:phage portal protein [Paracoccus sp. PAR01]|uniref:portal protein n=1 Tax=Paracoccus sp. PAR01 TaxID=2769282 RepID=UPI001785E128|nr:phage portal protein [Paracoccus sp. PAR01]MBD9528984.1 phage portal protein [Paracoccus sp. PAR01]